VRELFRKIFPAHESFCSSGNEYESQTTPKVWGKSEKKFIDNNNTPESCLENDSYKLYFDRTILTDIHIKHNRPDIIILNKQQKQAYLLDIAVPNSHNITQKLINI
jgi:hypothetical protein